MKRILLLAYHFPPEPGGGSFRPFALCRYLPEYGFDVTVVTRDTYGGLPGEAGVVRVTSAKNWRRKGRFCREFLWKGVSEGVQRLALPGLEDFLWQRRARDVIERLMAQERFDVVYATFPPLDTLLLAAAVARDHRIPLVIEFRDGFTFEPLTRHTPLQRRIASGVEKRIVHQAAAVITVGDNLSHHFTQSYPAARVFTVHNGFMADEFAGLPAAGSGGSKVRVAHFGSIAASRNRSLKPLLGALRQMKDAGEIGAETFELTLIGRFTPDELAAVDTVQMGDIVRFLPPMERREGFALIVREYDYLLFYGTPGETTTVSTKIFEYINLGKPILGICQGNEAAEIIRGTGTGEVVGFDHESICTLFRKVLARSVAYSPDSTVIASYDRRKQAQKIAGILSGVIDSTGGG